MPKVGDEQEIIYEGIPASPGIAIAPVHVIARGNVLIHIFNGQLISAFIDDDAKNRAMKGLLGLQLHVGPPMKIEFKNIYLKKL